MARRKLSDADQAAHRALRKLWDEKKDGLGLTQESVAEALERTPGLIGQYLNGHTALGPVACIRFAQILGVQPRDIRDDLNLGTLLPEELPPDVIEMAYKLAAVDKDTRADVARMIDIACRASYQKFVQAQQALAQARKSPAPN